MGQRYTNAKEDRATNGHSDDFVSDAAHVRFSRSEFR